MNSAIAAFKNATVRDALAMITCGFELETQSSDGLHANDLHQARHYFPRNYKLPDIHIGEDGSVRGFEFRTIGGLTWRKFMNSARAVFKIDHNIDVGCSFHIHIAVKGVKHTWTRRMQQSLTEYLLANADRVPSDVRDRWETANHHYSPKGTHEKYSFVHKHKQGTWEFRCFGNVHNAIDAKQCLILAVEALQHAYQRKPTIAKQCNLDPIAWGYLCRAAMVDRRPLAAPPLHVARRA